MDDSDRTASPPPGRRPYEPPSIRSERIFETTALACGKITGSACLMMGGLKVS